MPTADSPPSTTLSWAALSAPVGELTVVANATGVLRVVFSAPEPVLGDFSGWVLHESTGVAQEARSQLGEYFGGQRRRFDVPIDWSFAEGFRAGVLRTLFDRVGFGETVSYQGLAELSGRPSAARSVGTIMGSNPVPIIVPCHRVLASGGGMGGFGPGLEAKRRLLVLEGVLGPSLLDDFLPL